MRVDLKATLQLISSDPELADVTTRPDRWSKLLRFVWCGANHQFQFEKRGQLLIRARKETVSVAAMCVNNADCSRARIDGGHVAQLQPAFLNCLRLFPHRSCAAPAHTHGVAIDSTGAHGDAYSISNHLRIVALPVGVCVTPAYGQDPGRLSVLLLEPIETEDSAKRVHRFLLRDFPEVFAFHLFVLIEELLFRFIANQRFAFARPGFGD